MHFSNLTLPCSYSQRSSWEDKTGLGSWTNLFWLRLRFLASFSSGKRKYLVKNVFEWTVQQDTNNDTNRQIIIRDEPLAFFQNPFGPQKFFSTNSSSYVLIQYIKFAPGEKLPCLCYFPRLCPGLCRCPCPCPCPFPCLCSFSLSLSKFLSCPSSCPCPYHCPCLRPCHYYSPRPCLFLCPVFLFANEKQIFKLAHR